jgi:hypothetical protein
MVFSFVRKRREQCQYTSDVRVATKEFWRGQPVLAWYSTVRHRRRNATRTMIGTEEIKRMQNSIVREPGR